MTAKKVINKQPGKTLPLEDIAREMLYRTWFPKDLKFTPDGMTSEDVEAVVVAFERFAEANILIKVPGDRIPMVLREAQRDTLLAWVTNRKTIALKARQVGFSTLIATFTLWCALQGADRQIYLLSKKETASRALLSKARYAYRNLPEWVRDRPGTPKLIDRTLQVMTFDNDSFLVSAPSASDPIRGETAWLAVIDEWASLPSQEEAWAAVEPTADLGGRIIGLSTAKGEGDFFHDTWVGAETGSNGFTPIFHSWRAVPQRDQAWYDLKKKQNPLWFMHQEYPDNPEEAFIGSGNPFFDLDVLRTFKPVEAAFLYNPHMELGEPVMSPSDDGDLLVWEAPSPRFAYAIGADVAMGLEKGDWSVAFVVKVKTGEVVAMYRGKPSPMFFGEQVLNSMGRWYNDALLCPEVNNHGLTTITKLMDADYPNLYRRRSKLNRRETVYEVLGFQTNRATKPALMDRIQDWLYEGHQVFDVATIHELKTFVREQRGDKVALHGSPHDDTVIALGLTLEAARYAEENNLAEPKLSNIGSIEWHVARLDKGQKRRRLSPVM